MKSFLTPIFNILFVLYAWCETPGEWWNRDPIQVVNQATLTGAAPNISDAFTINGQPGDLYPCSSSGAVASFFFLDL